jgi:hypothetical protein
MLTNLPQIRYILGPQRSGTSLLQRALSTSANHLGIFEPLRAEIAFDKKLTYSVFKQTTDPECHTLMKEFPDKIFILKDALGRTIRRELGDEIFPSPNDIKRSAPLFVFRNPLDTFRSVQRQGWYSHDAFISLQEQAFTTFNKLKELYNNVSVITYEKLVSDPENYLRQICSKWNIKFENTMIEWNKKYLDAVKYHPEGKKELLQTNFQSSLMTATSFKPKKVTLPVPENSLEEKIYNTLNPRYKSIKNQAEIDFIESLSDK